MVTYLALLRGVNVGGHGKVAMGDLRGLAAGLGLREAQTVLQSGNLVFRSAVRSSSRLEAVLESEIAGRLALQTSVFIRTAGEWAALVAANPFPGEAARAPSRVVVFLLKSAPLADGVAALRAALTGAETVAVEDRQLYAFYPENIGRSRLTGALVERKLGTLATARNWNTVLRLAVAAPLGR